MVVEREHRDQRHLQRHDEQRDHGDEDPVAAREVEPRERVAGERADQDHEQRVRDGDLERDQQRVRDRVVVQHHPVVLEGGEARLREDLPPALHRERLRRQDRREEEPERRDEPEQPEQRRATMLTGAFVEEADGLPADGVALGELRLRD